MKKLIFLGLSMGLMTVLSCSNKERPDAENEVVKERVRPSHSGGTSAAYFRYQNPLGVADTLIEIQAAVAEMVQVHESYKTKDGMMGMRQKERLIVPPGDELQFKQGGLHVMLMGVSKKLAPGDSVKLSLEFSRAGNVEKILPVTQ